MQKGIVIFGIEDEQALIKHHFDGLSPGTFNHEFGACFAEDCRSFVNQLAGIGLNAQVNAAFCLGCGNALRRRWHYC